MSVPFESLLSLNEVWGVTLRELGCAIDAMDDKTQAIAMPRYLWRQARDCVNTYRGAPVVNICVDGKPIEDRDDHFWYEGVRFEIAA